MPSIFDEDLDSLAGITGGGKPYQIPTGGVNLDAIGGVTSGGVDYQQALAQGLRAQGSPLASPNREGVTSEGGLMPYLQAPTTWNFGQGGAPSSAPFVWGERASAAGDRERWAAYQQKLADAAAAAEAKRLADLAAQQQAYAQQRYWSSDVSPSGGDSGIGGDGDGGDGDGGGGDGGASGAGDGGGAAW